MTRASGDDKCRFRIGRGRLSAGTSSCAFGPFSLLCRLPGQTAQRPRTPSSLEEALRRAPAASRSQTHRGAVVCRIHQVKWQKWVGLHLTQSHRMHIVCARPPFILVLAIVLRSALCTHGRLARPPQGSQLATRGIIRGSPAFDMDPEQQRHRKSRRGALPARNCTTTAAVKRGTHV